MIDVIIPIRTVSEANASEHRFKKHKRHKAQKRAINLTLSGPIRQKLSEIDLTKQTLSIRLTRIAPRELDKDDNLPMAFKYIKDYIADIIIPGKRPGRADDCKNLIWYYNQEKGKPKEYSIRIEIF